MTSEVVDVGLVAEEGGSEGSNNNSLEFSL